MDKDPFDFRNEKLREVVEFVASNPNKYTIQELTTRFNLSADAIASGIRRAKRMYNLQVKKEQGGPKGKRYPSSTRTEYIPLPPDTSSVLVIGDLHVPFDLEEYFDFCVSVYKTYKITHVIFIGDIIDNHYSSFHVTDPDGMGGGDELSLAIDRLERWIQAFPSADVVIGNHDRIIMRKAFEGGIPRRWIMSYQDVLGAPGWNFTEGARYDGIHYIHGEGATARNRARKDLCSTVQGHRHPEAYTDYIVGEAFKIFGMQVGCGIDRHSYAMAYAKDHPKPAIGVGVILNNGKMPFNVLMEL